MPVVTRAGHLREWSQGELWLYVNITQVGVTPVYKAAAEQKDQSRFNSETDGY